MYAKHNTSGIEKNRCLPDHFRFCRNSQRKASPDQQAVVPPLRCLALAVRCEELDWIQTTREGLIPLIKNVAAVYQGLFYLIRLHSSEYSRIPESQVLTTCSDTKHFQQNMKEELRMLSWKNILEGSGLQNVI